MSLWLGQLGNHASRMTINLIDCDLIESCAAWQYEHKWWNRELILKCKLKFYVKPMKDPLGVSPSKGNQGTTRGKEKILLTSAGIEPTTSGLDLVCLLSCKF